MRRFLFAGLVFTVAAASAQTGKPDPVPAAISAELAKLYPGRAHGLRAVVTADLNRDGRQDWAVLVGLRSGPADPDDSWPYESERLVVFFSQRDGSLAAPAQSGDLAYERRGWSEMGAESSCLIYKHFNSGSASSHSYQRFEFCPQGRELVLSRLESTSEDSCCDDYPKESAADVLVRQGRLTYTESRNGKSTRRQLRFRVPPIRFEGFEWDGYQNRFPAPARDAIP